MTKPKSKPGRKPFVPTKEQRETVRSMAAFGVPAHEIAPCLHVSEATLKRKFREELHTSGIRATARIAGLLYQKCLDGNLVAIIFWLKTRGRWAEARDPQPVEVSGSVSVDSDKLMAKLALLADKADVDGHEDH